MEATELEVEENGRQESNEGKYYYDISKWFSWTGKFQFRESIIAPAALMSL
jgi:hypothetical protein